MVPVGGVPVPPTSPWSQHFEDYLGRAIDFTVTFDDTTRILIGISCSRDANCNFQHVFIGTGADGVPDDTDKVVNVNFTGTRALTTNQMNVLASRGLTTIEDITALQIAAGI